MSSLSSSSVLDLDPTVGPRWRLAQGIVLLLSLGLGVAWFLVPVGATDLFWQGLVPLLPATFLLNPLLWRNVCPVATVNELGTRLGATRRPSEALVRRMTGVGAAWLVVAIAARRPWLDGEPRLTALLIGSTVLLALLLGLRFVRKSGFCNTVCPVLAVERFYGQSPLLGLENGRCASCDACTSTGCLDLVPHRALAYRLGRRRGAFGWMTSPTGLLVATFPGVVVAYFTLGPDASIARTSTRFLLCMAGSAILLALVAAAMRDRGRFTRLVAATTAFLYYLFAAPAWARYVGLGESGGWVVLLLALGLVSIWAWRAVLPERWPAR